VGKRLFPISDLRGVKIVSRFLGILDFRLKSSRKAVFPISRLTRKEEGLIVGQIETQIRPDVRLYEKKKLKEKCFWSGGNTSKIPDFCVIWPFVVKYQIIIAYSASI
ncbi:MAG: hypothetical protein IKG93_11725, partial [Clostridiales bacterium]|nr:hypothetical protein [Clostridiales bacterium]